MSVLLKRKPNRNNKKKKPKYLEVIEKLLQLSANEWPNFPKRLRNTYGTQEETKNLLKKKTKKN